MTPGLMQALRLAVCAVLVSFGIAAAPLPAFAQANWSARVSATEAGHLRGNPAARMRLVVFSSYSCPHCLEFERQSEGPLQLQHVAGGTVSVELRHYIRNPLDLAAALASECGAPARFFARHRAILHAQPRWLAVANKASATQQQRWTGGPVPQRMRAIAADLGFYELLAPHGLNRPALDRCLSDVARAEELAASSRAQGERFAVPGTPSFLLEGRLLQGVHDWPGVQRALAANGG